MVNLVETFRQQQEIALARERRLHIDAAAAQLETLRRLELEREKKASTGLVRFVEDGHLTKRLSSGPDIGAGGALRNSSIRYNSGNSDDFGSFGSLSSDVINQSNVHFEESAHSIGPPTHAFAQSSMINGGEELQNSTHLRARNVENHRDSVIHYADAGLSMELRGLLNRSSLIDPYASDHSFTGSLVPIDESSMSILGIRSDQQVRHWYFLNLFLR